MKVEFDVYHASALDRVGAYREYEFRLDDLSWDDLMMNDVMKAVNRTVTFPGLQTLYARLRHPVVKQSQLQELSNDVGAVESNRMGKQAILKPLKKLGMKDGEWSAEFLWKDVKMRKIRLWPYLLAQLLPISVIAFVFICPPLAVLLGIMTVFINMPLYLMMKKSIAQDIGAIAFLSRAIRCASEIMETELGIALARKDMKELVQQCKKICSYAGGIRMGQASGGAVDLSLLIDYFNMVFLIEPVVYKRLLRMVTEKQTELTQLYEQLGYVDFVISLAGQAEEKGWCRPDFASSNTDDVAMVDLRHPLLEDAIPNSVSFRTGALLITGSNMTGKSTFLRTIGVNCILAQSIIATRCSNYLMPLVKVVSSIDIHDSLLNGESHFLAEAKSIKRMVDEDNLGARCLFLIDEIFAGTNTQERVAAARAVLEYLAESSAYVVTATHDLELAVLEKVNFINWHFDEQVGDEGLEFDYKLKAGPCESRNAIQVLRHIGYPEDLYERAMEYCKS